MKRLLLFAATALLALPSQAQTVDDGLKMYHYERYETAKEILTPLAASDEKANYYLGLSELALENPRGAEAVFSKDLKSFYNKAGLARVRFTQEKSAEATKLLNEIVDNAKKRDWEMYKVAADAITYTKGGDINSAIAWYQKALEREQNAMLYIGLGDAYLTLQTGGGEAMNNYEAAIEKGTHNSLAYSRIGYLWYVAQNYEKALESYNLAKDADPSNPLPYRDLAQAYQRSGRYENALANIESYLAKSDKTTNDQITYANLLYLAKKYPEAEAKMEELLASGVERPYMYRIIAYSAFENKKYPKALENMRTFFQKEQDPAEIINSDYIYAGKIMLAMSAEDSLHAEAFLDSADQYFTTAISKDTSADKAELYREIGDGFKDARNYAKAAEWYGKIIAENADAAPLDYFYWGYWSFYARDYEQAKNAFQTMAQKYPNEGSALYWQARIAAAQDDEAKTGAAVELYKKWMNFKFEGYEHRDADLMFAYQYLAYYYYNQNNKAESVSWANKILEKDPQNEFANQIVDYFKDK